MFQKKKKNGADVESYIKCSSYFEIEMVVMSVLLLTMIMLVILLMGAIGNGVVQPTYSNLSPYTKVAALGPYWQRPLVNKMLRV